MKASEATSGVWISINEERPNICEKVLIYDREYDLITIGFVADEKTSWFYGAGDGFTYSSVTHWAPIPSKPQLKKKITGVKKNSHSSVDWVSLTDGYPNIGTEVWVYAPPIGVMLCTFVHRVEWGFGFIPEPGYEQIPDEFYGKDGSLNCVTHWFPFRRSKKRPDAPSAEPVVERTS